MLIGVHQAFDGFEEQPFIASRIKSNTFQCFMRNNRNMSIRNFNEGNFRQFSANMFEYNVYNFVIHASYALNPCSPEDELRDRTVAVINQDLSILSRLGGIKNYVLHPGSAMGQTFEEAFIKLEDTIKRIKPADYQTFICLETMAGQGTQIMSTLPQLESLMLLCRRYPYVKICLDTCHLFAAGIKYNEFFSLLDKYGRELLGVVHVNGSSKPFGSRVDRHTSVQLGYIRPALQTDICARVLDYGNVPIILETPTTTLLQDYQFLYDILSKYVPVSNRTSSYIYGE